MTASINDYPKISRSEWVLNWPGQIVLSVSQLYWTSSVHHGISNGLEALNDYLEESNE